MDKFDYYLNKIGGIIFCALATIAIIAVLFGAIHQILTALIGYVLGIALLQEAKKMKEEDENPTYKGEL